MRLADTQSYLGKDGEVEGWTDSTVAQTLLPG